MRAAYAAARRVHGDFRPILVAQNLGILEDPGTRGLGRTCHALSELEGVQVAAARVDQSSEIAAALYMSLQLAAVQELHGRVAVLFMQFTSPIGQLLKMPRFDGNVNMVGVVVALDGVLFDQLLREIRGLDGQIV